MSSGESWDLLPPAEHLGLTFHMTCPAYPEQYDVLDAEGNQVGYARLRHGVFRVDAQECGGPTVLVQSFSGEPTKGEFSGPGERDFWLDVAARRLQGQP